MISDVLGRHLWLTTPMMRGEDVFHLQVKLTTVLGRSLDQDGMYGLQTKRAVEEYQRQQGLSADGIVGAATWNKLRGAATARPDHALADVLDDDRIADLKKSHRRYADGCSWRLDASGVVIGDATAASPASSADLVLVQRVRNEFAQPIATAIGPGQGCMPVPVELIIATICTESSGNPRAKRLEPGCDTVDPERTPHRISIGLMQTLLSTAREARSMPSLRLDDLLIPKESIAAGAAYIWRQARITRFDPPLVAAAYNAGGVYYNSSPQNAWRLRQYPIGTSKHVDRFVRFFNAAMSDAQRSAYEESIPSLARVMSGN